MDDQQPLFPFPFADSIDRWVRRGVHFGKRAALAFGLAAVSAIALAAAVSDNGLVQIVVTLFAAFALWVPVLVALLWGERALRRRPAAVAAAKPAAPARTGGGYWQRLTRAAPDQHERIAAIERSVERSQRRLSAARLDPEAHDLCILIDRRLPDLIDRELDALPPDDRGRGARVNDLIGLVEQFARHCGRHGQGDGAAHEREAEILRRRFQDRLAAAPLEPQ